MILVALSMNWRWICCRSSFVAFKLLDYFGRVIGTDISATMIRQCRDNVKPTQNIEFIQGSAEQAPSRIQENSLDLITEVTGSITISFSKNHSES